MDGKFHEAGIPERLKATPQWIVWKLTERDGKPDKPPFDARTGRPGDVRDPAVHLPFALAVEAAPRFAGIGFAFTPGDPFCGIDLDDCFDAEGTLEPWAERIVEGLRSYTERSPSGKGLHVIVVGRLPPAARHKLTGLGTEGKGSIEFYDRARYFTVTGDHWPGTPAMIEDRAEELLAFHAEAFPPRPASNGRKADPRPVDLSDQAILERARQAGNGEQFAALFDRGDTGRYAGDDSRADLALCSHLAFWTGGAVDVMDRLFRCSALYRDKWDERRGPQTYGERTILRALEGMRGFYDPHRPRPSANGHAGSNGHHPPSPTLAIGAPGEPAPTETEDDPHRLARLYLTQYLRHPDGPTLIFWNDEWHGWDGTTWRTRPDKEIAAELTGSIKAEFDRLSIASGKPSRAVTTRVLNNVLLALRSLTVLPLHGCPCQPAWIGPGDAGEDLPPAREVVGASNALIHLPSFAGGVPYVLALTPRFFSPNTLGYPFQAGVPAPSQWLAFLNSLWPDDPEAISALQEWFGYLLTPDTSLQKILMLIGPKRSGKGTIARILRALVGPGNIAAPTLSSLAMPFGLQPLIGKTVALLSDARLSNRADQSVIVERLLSISGEDAQSVDRKNMTSWTGVLTTRFVLISNELPRLKDVSGAMTGRMVLLTMTRSFFGREDTTLTDRLLVELPGILLWSIEGWQRLRRRGHFVQPSSGQESIEDLEELSSPVGAFIAERCQVGPQWSIPVKDLFDAWQSYCKEKGNDFAGDAPSFGRNLRAVLPNLKTSRPHQGEGRIRVFSGIGLRLDWPVDGPSSRVAVPPPPGSTLTWVVGYLGFKPMPLARIVSDAAGFGIDRPTLERAFAVLDCEREVIDGVEHWTLPSR